MIWSQLKSKPKHWLLVWFIRPLLWYSMVWLTFLSLQHWHFYSELILLFWSFQVNFPEASVLLLQRFIQQLFLIASRTVFGCVSQWSVKNATHTDLVQELSWKEQEAKFGTVSQNILFFTSATFNGHVSQVKELWAQYLEQARLLSLKPLSGRTPTWQRCKGKGQNNKKKIWLYNSKISPI